MQLSALTLQIVSYHDECLSHHCAGSQVSEQRCKLFASAATRSRRIAVCVMHNRELRAAAQPALETFFAVSMLQLMQRLTWLTAGCCCHPASL